jgi:hypothetical protein
MGRKGFLAFMTTYFRQPRPPHLDRHYSPDYKKTKYVNPTPPVHSHAKAPTTAGQTPQRKNPSPNAQKRPSKHPSLQKHTSHEKTNTPLPLIIPLHPNTQHQRKQRPNHKNRLHLHHQSQYDQKQPFQRQLHPIQT